MTTIKIYPPKQLPSEGVSEPAFNIWREELEVYLEIDNRFQKFLPGGDYQTWEAAESFPNRIRAVKPEDLPENLQKRATPVPHHHCQTHPHRLLQPHHPPLHQP